MSGADARWAGDSRWDHFIYTVFRFVICGITRIVTRVTIEGRENLPTSGAYILAPVHRSYVDTPITFASRLSLSGTSRVPSSVSSLPSTRT